MSLEELKQEWDSLEEENIISHSLTSDKIKSMVERKYRSRINRTLLLDLFILGVNFYFIVLITFRFNELGENYLEVLGIISVLLLVSLFFLRILKVINIFRWGYLKYSYSQRIKKLAVYRIRIQKYYLLNIAFGFFLLMSILILNTKIYKEYDITQSEYFWGITIPICLLFLILFNKWREKYYKEAVKEAKELLNELES